MSPNYGDSIHKKFLSIGNFVVLIPNQPEIFSLIQSLDQNPYMPSPAIAGADSR
jgi:hypothetical protein